MAALTDIRDALEERCEGLATANPEMFAGVDWFFAGEVVPPSYDEQRSAPIWIQALVRPTERGEERMGGAYQQLASLTFSINSPREAVNRRDELEAALEQSFEAINLGPLVVEYGSRSESDDADVSTWYNTTLTLDCWYDVPA